VPRQPTYYVSSEVSQPLSQLFRIGLGIQSATTTSEIERERARAKELSVINSVKRLYFAILQTESALTATEELHQKGGRYALCTMCIGVGQGIASVWQAVE